MSIYPTYKLGDVAEIILGQSPESKSYNTKGEGLPFFQGKTEFTDWFPIPNKWCTEPKKIAEPFDVLLSVRAPVGPTNIAKEKCCIGRGLAAIRYADCYKYVLYYLRSVSKYLESKATGTTFSSISGDTIKNLPIPLPPLPTQHAIVSRIETLFAELDKAVQHLRTAQQQIKTYRQAVLNHWLNNDDGKWEKKTAEECVVNENYSLAIGPFGSDLKVEDYTESGVKLVFVRDITSNFEDKKNKFVSEYKADQLKAHNVFKGDLLITKMGDPPGQTGIFPYDRGVITSDVLRMKTNDKILNKYYAMYYILSSEGGKQIKEMTQGVAQKKISLGRFKKFLFPIPSIPEQQHIVNEIESRLSQATATETCIENALQQAEALRQSILKKAFNGELI